MSPGRIFRSLAVAAALLGALFSPVKAQAAEGGYTHYGPGFYGDFGVAVAPEPGFYLRNDFYYYTGDASRRRIFKQIPKDGNRFK